MGIEIKGVDVAGLLEDVRRRIEEKKQGLVTDAEIREIAERPLQEVLVASEFRSGLLRELQADAARWGYSFDPETVYRSSRGGAGRLLEAVRRLLRPVQKLFWNPNPMISALSRQSSLNSYYADLFHNLAEELTRLRLEVQDLRNRNLQLQGRLELLVRREKVLEDLALRDRSANPPAR